MLIGSYSLGLVVLSVLMAMGSAYVALDLATRVTAATGRARLYWLSGGATSMGIGIWSMHYIGMLAFSLPIPILYDVPTVLASLLAAVLASGIALSVVSRERLTVFSMLAGSIVMGGAVATMHYVGMEAMRLKAMCHYDAEIVALSIVIAVVVSLVALWLTFRMRTESRVFAPLKLASAGLMGVAVAAMHYTGMAAVHYMPSDTMMGSIDRAVTISSIDELDITLVAFMVLGLAILTSVVDRRMSAKDLAIKSSEARYRALFDRSLAGVYQSTLDGRMLDCNEALARIVGYSTRAECLQRQSIDFYLSARERETFLCELRTHGRLTDFESRLRRSDGSLVWVLESATLVEGSGGQPPWIEGTLIDISRRKETERQLAARTDELTASMERYKQLVENTNAMPWEMDGGTLLFTYVSPQALRLYGRDSPEVVGSAAAWNLVYPPDRERVRAQFAALANSGEGHLDVEYRVVSGAHRIVHVRSIASVQPVAAGAPVVLRGIMLDITDQRKLEMELQQAQKLESVGRLASGIAHEINTPVQFVSDSVHFVRDAARDLTTLIERYRALPASPDPMHAEARAAVTAAEEELDLEYLMLNIPLALDRSLEGLDRVATIVRSMKEFAHPDQKDMTPVNLNHAIESTLAVARNEYKYIADIDLNLGDIPQVTCFSGDVNQAVLNILVNAAHAIETANAGTDRRGRIGVRTSQDGDDVLIAISDTGGGIPEAIRAQVFDLFFTTKEVGKGTGQGLAIARSVIVDKHAGALTFDSRQNEGTTFVMRLPIAGKRVVGVAA